jgi:hypothetical protein
MIKHTEVFVFGSNTQGLHGAGAAREAWKNHGAEYGIGYGLSFNDKGASFAIPTKDRHIQTLPTAAVERFVKGFLTFAESRPDLTFKISRIGCGLAGFKDDRMAAMFAFAPLNCLFDTAWKPYLPNKVGLEFWGTF